MSKKYLTLTSFLMIAAFVLSACGAAATGGGPAPAAGGELYFLNFKPEVAELYEQTIAPAYKEETGVTLKVVTAASGTYEQTLRSEVAKSDPPVLFQINGPIGYQSWKDYTADLSGTELYAHLPDKTMAVTDGDGVYGLPYVVEGYGIIYNNAIMTAYFALPNAKAASMDEVNNFAALKEVVEDMQARKAELGIEGVFASTSLKPGEDWRWQTHLANVPIFYEFRDNNVVIPSDATKAATFQYNENFKNIFDLYLNNSVSEPTLLGSKSVDDSMAEFALGKAAMVQNGNWAWNQINAVEGNTVAAEDVKFLPIYTGMAGEEAQSICVGTENFFSINSQAPADKQKLAADFIWWLFSSPTGKAFVTNDLKFIAPFDTFSAADAPDDPLAREVNRYVTDPDLYNVSWNFVVFPSQTFKDNFGGALLQYAQGSMEWDAVVDLFVEQWAAESG